MFLGEAVRKTATRREVASTCPAAVARLLGASPPLSAGAVHVVAVWQDAAQQLRVLRIAPQTPRSEDDFSLLQAARARAEAIVTTGSIVRSEGGLDYRPRGPERRALLAWRRALGLSEPILSVLSSGRALELDAGALHAGVRPMVFTSFEGRRLLQGQPRAEEVELVAAPEPSLRALLAELHRRRVRRITLEAGPSTMRELYRAPVAVDELWLSRFLGTPPADVVGGVLFSTAHLERGFLATSKPVDLPAASGVWRFQRFRPARWVLPSAGPEAQSE